MGHRQHRRLPPLAFGTGVGPRPVLRMAASNACQSAGDARDLTNFTTTFVKGSGPASESSELYPRFPPFHALIKGIWWPSGWITGTRALPLASVGQVRAIAGYLSLIHISEPTRQAEI